MKHRQDARDATARTMIPRGTARRAVFVLRASTRRADDPQGVRSRCVAQEVNTHQRDDASGTPPLKAPDGRLTRSHEAVRRAQEQEAYRAL